MLWKSQTPDTPTIGSLALTAANAKLNLFRRYNDSIAQTNQYIDEIRTKIEADTDLYNKVISASDATRAEISRIEKNLNNKRASSVVDYKAFVAKIDPLVLETLKLDTYKCITNGDKCTDAVYIENFEKFLPLLSEGLTELTNTLKTVLDSLTSELNKCSTNLTRLRFNKRKAEETLAGLEMQKSEAETTFNTASTTLSNIKARVQAVESTITELSTLADF